MADCRGCGRPIYWVTNVETGKPMPLDPKPVIGGNVVVTENDEARVLSKRDAGDRAARNMALYVSHFATCPKAHEFRGQR